MRAEAIAFAVLTAAALYLLLFGLVASVKPETAGRFLSGFAQTRLANGVEAGARFITGVAMIVAAPALQWPLAWQVAGSFLGATAAWMVVFSETHRRVAARSTQWIKPNVRFLGLAAIAMGAAFLCLLWA